MIANDLKLPVYILNGVNFSARVELDQFNAEQDIICQQYECGVRLIETLEKLRDDNCVAITMHPDAKNDSVLLGPVILCHQEGTDIEKQVPLRTYLCYSDAGLYKTADEQKVIFDKLFAEQKKKFSDQQKNKAKLEKELKDFAEFQKETLKPAPKKPTKKPRKKS